jgi:hypothetical protein
MRKIASKHEEFSYEFDGKDINVIVLIPVGEKRFEKSLLRFYGIDNFIKSLTLYIKTISGIINVNYMSNKYVHVNKYIVGWRYHPATGMQPVEVFPTDDVEMILKKSVIGSREIGIDKLDLIKWGTILEPIKVTKEFKEVNLDELPNCIKKIIKKTKSKKETELLTRFLLSIYSPNDSKKLLSVIGEVYNFDFILSNLDSLGSPNCVELKKYCDKECVKSHPLEGFDGS